MKTEAISSWRAEHLDEGRAIFRNALLTPLFQRILKGSDSSRDRADFLQWMETLLDRYKQISVIDRRGIVRFSSLSPSGEPLDSRAMELTAEAWQTGRIVLSDLYRTRASAEIRMDLQVPLFLDQNNKTSAEGLLLLQIDPATSLYPLLQTWPIPGRSFETLLVRREGDDVLYLNELRHRQDTALTLRFPLSKKGLPAALAAQGKEEIYEGIDYRDVPVLSVTRVIPDSPWFLVAKEAGTKSTLLSAGRAGRSGSCSPD